MKPENSEERIKLLEKRVCELEKDLSLYKSIFEVLPHGVQIFDQEGFSFDLNRAQTKILGAEKDEGQHRQFNILKDPLSIAMGSNVAFEKAYRGEQNERMSEFNADLVPNDWPLRKDIRIFHESIIPLKDESGNVDYVITVMEDHTDKVKALSALQESEMRWKFAVEGSNDGLWDWNILTDEIYYSKRLIEMLGFTDKDPLRSRLDLEKLIHPNDKEEFIELVSEHLEGRAEYFEYLHRLLCKDGSYKWILKRGKVISYTKDGKPERMIGTHRDVTKFKEIEEELRRNKVLLSENEKLSKVGAWEYIPETDVVYHTQGYNMIYEIDQDTETSNFNTHLNCFDPKDQLKIIDVFNSCISRGTAYDLEFPITTLKQNKRWVRIKTNPVFENGVLMRVIGSLADITEQKQKETILNELTATKEKFFSIIAHDLRSPVNAIIGFSELIFEAFEENKIAGIERYSRLIHTAATQNLGFLNVLLEWSKTQSENFKFKSEKINLYNLVSKITDFLAVNIAQKRISLVNNIGQADTVYANSFMLETVIRNLLSNAIKYSNQTGSIQILSVENEEGTVISVADNGIGIAESDIPKLFRIDTNFSYPGTNNEKGTGLGLILCSEFVEKQGGRIWVESEIRKGSTFSFNIPRKVKT